MTKMHPVSAEISHCKIKTQLQNLTAVKLTTTFHLQIKLRHEAETTNVGTLKLKLLRSTERVNPNPNHIETKTTEVH